MEVAHTLKRDKVFAKFIGAAIEHVEEQIREMNATVPRLEKAARQRVENAFSDEGERWRALASPSFIRMVDTLTLLQIAEVDPNSPDHLIVVVEA